MPLSTNMLAKLLIGHSIINKLEQKSKENGITNLLEDHAIPKKGEDDNMGEIWALYHGKIQNLDHNQ